MAYPSKKIITQTTDNACGTGQSVARLSKTIQRVYLFLALLLIIVLIVTGSLIVLGIEKYNQEVLENDSSPSLLGNAYFVVGIATSLIATTLVIFAVAAYSTVATDLYAVNTLKCIGKRNVDQQKKELLPAEESI